MKALADSSYTVVSNALQALSKIDSAAAETEAQKLIATLPLPLPARLTEKSKEQQRKTGFPKEIPF